MVQRFNRKKYYQLIQQHNTKRLIELRKNPCTDCGKTFDPVVMEFDHRDPRTKTGDISALTMATWERIQKELDKCDLVCANCHNIRSAQQRKNGLWDKSKSCVENEEMESRQYEFDLK